jgi:hypothetical protein
MPLHEHRVQRPIEILARADPRRLHGFERIEHRARPDRNSRRPQRAREIEDVLGQPAWTRGAVCLVLHIVVELLRLLGRSRASGNL